MEQKTKEKIEARIREDIAALGEQIRLLEEKCRPIAPDCSLGRLTRMEAMGEQEVSAKILDESRLRLTRLRSAFSRIDKESFGVCIECEEDIDPERMMIRPESVRCVACANRH